MGLFDKSAGVPVVQDKIGAESDEVGYASINEGTVKKVTRISSVITVLVSGLALFSDGYNAQIIGYMEPLFSDLYKQGFSDSIATRLSNSYLIGEIFGMLFFGFLIDKIGRRTGIVFATLFLVLGIILATAAHGLVGFGRLRWSHTILICPIIQSELGLFWMMIIGRGVAGFGAGGKSKCLTCARTNSGRSVGPCKTQAILDAQEPADTASRTT